MKKVKTATLLRPITLSGYSGSAIAPGRPVGCTLVHDTDADMLVMTTREGDTVGFPVSSAVMIVYEQEKPITKQAPPATKQPDPATTEAPADHQLATKPATPDHQPVTKPKAKPRKP